MTLLNIVTAVSRPSHLPRIHSSMESTIHLSSIPVRWILVFDAPGHLPDSVTEMLAAPSRVRLEKVIYPGGPVKFGIHQKNAGIDLIQEGFYHCLDDDNIVHPKFFEGFSRLLAQFPEKKAFAFSQLRWDGHGNLRADPARMKPGFIDNTMFAVHKDLIGERRYDLAQAGMEDGFFFQALYDENPETFAFSAEFLAYYNYLRHFP